MLEDLAETIDVKQLTTQLIEFLPQLFIAVLILIAFWLLARLAQRVCRAALTRAGFEKVLIRLLVDNLVKYVVLCFGVLIALDQLGVNVAAALAGVGVVGIAVGFAAQDAFANVISGILIFWDKPFVVGDWIKTEGNYGKVTNITLRTTRIRTPNNTFIVIPNKRIIDEVLENRSKHGELRVDVPIGIAYKEDIEQARSVLLEALGKVGGLNSDPEPDVVVTELGDSSVNLSLRGWIDEAGDERSVFFAMLEEAKRALDAADIEIPFPHLQLFVDEVKSPVWQQAQKLARTG